jgi:long-chain acyl-CoA synthetase
MKTHIEFFLDWKDKKPNEVFLRQPHGTTWKETTWAEAYNQSARIAAAMQAMGVEKGSNVAILSKNCMHWILADMAIIMAGYISTPFFPNLSKEEFRDLIKRSEAKVLFIGKLDQPIWESLKNEVPADVKVIAFPHYDGNAEIALGEKWDDLMSKHQPIEKPHIPQLDDLWTILFTSGTTGAPKGVMLSYRSPAALMAMELKHDQIGIFKSKEYQFFSYLPLNHIAERMIVEIACLLTGGTISFAESLDTFAQNLQQVQPTSFMSVPRIYTKFQLAVIEKLGSKLDFLLKIPFINSLLKKKIREGFGLSRAGVILTGAAPTPQSLKNWYAKLGIDLREIYGMTENAGGCCVMPQNFTVPNFVGKALPEVELKIDDENGEVIMKAPWNMLGYFKEPELTAEVLQDGWIKTGDCGIVNDEGYLKLTGRASDTFKTSKGKFIVPGPMEWKLSENHNIEQVCVAGLGLNQPLALINLSEIGKNADKDELEKSLEDTIRKINKDLPSYQHLSKAVVINEEWTVDMGLLTPTMKIKRKKVNERYDSLMLDWERKDNMVVYYGK